MLTPREVAFEVVRCRPNHRGEPGPDLLHWFSIRPAHARQLQVVEVNSKALLAGSPYGAETFVHDLRRKQNGGKIST